MATVVTRPSNQYLLEVDGLAVTASSTSVAST
jgi:hypothetical protein